jgi:hypothetical protein
MKKFVIIAVLTLVVLSPLTLHAQADSMSSCSSIKSFSGLVDCLVGFINNAIYIIIAAAVLYIVWGAFIMIRSEEKRDEGKAIILNGIIGLFVMVSVWGFVNILNTTFKLDTAPIEPTPFRAPN